MNRICKAAFSLLLSLTTLCAVAEDYAEQAAAIERGNAHYLVWCANCHGVDGDGRGPLVPMLKVAPSDLTLLRRSGKGTPVGQRVLDAVAGRHRVPTGGHRRMPVFADNLEIRTVVEIADYLETIQK
jgi:mono/diheme cytochrome c family protein